MTGAEKQPKQKTKKTKNKKTKNPETEANQNRKICFCRRVERKVSTRHILRKLQPPALCFYILLEFYNK